MGGLGRVGPDQNQNVNKTNGTQSTPTTQQQNANVIKQQHHDQQRISHEQVISLLVLRSLVDVSKTE